MNKVKNWIKKEWTETKLLMKNIPGLLMTFFVLSLVLMNLLANKSIDLGVSWLALDCGIIVSWLAFLVMDILVKHFGPKASTRLTIVAIGLNLLVSLTFMAAAAIPGMWGESFVENGNIINTALNNTISGTWYVLLGSTIAFAVSSLVNNLLNWLIGKQFKKNPDSFWAYASRSYISTMIAQIVDNLVFALIVSYNFFGWSFLQCLTCAITGGLVELLCEIIFSPIGYKVTKKWKEKGIGKEYLDYISQCQTSPSIAVSTETTPTTNKPTNTQTTQKTNTKTKTTVIVEDKEKDDN